MFFWESVYWGESETTVEQNRLLESWLRPELGLPSSTPRSQPLREVQSQKFIKGA